MLIQNTLTIQARKCGIFGQGTPNSEKYFTLNSANCQKFLTI